MIKDSVVILLAGGESTRFWPLEEKNCIPFLGKSFLLWHYEQLLRCGLSRTVVVTNEGNEAVIKSVAVPKGLSVSFVKQKEKGQGQAILALKHVIDDKPILILNASDYYSDEFLTSFLSHVSGDITLGAVRVNTYFPGGYLKLDSAGNVLEIIEKPGSGSEPSDVVRIVADYFPNGSTIVEAVKTYGDDPIAGYEVSINKLIKQKTVCKAEITSLSSWKYLKYPWAVLSMMDLFLSNIKKSQIHPSVDIKKNVFIEGLVLIEEGVKIFEGTKIVGPVYIGKNTIIGNNNIIRKSHIGANCLTGFNSDITRSYIGDNSWFHTNYLGDSVIGNNVSMGSGTVCANLRLDDGEITSSVKGEKVKTGKNKLGAIIGDNVRIGVNTSIMPGVKIGHDSFIGAGIVVDVDLESGKFMFLKSGKCITVDNTKRATASRDEFRKVL
jgi:bifunctional UDP-N-acetylglucosamine pyrophosphorylase/glucosamine-1-phosphate N-acetyltransferase